MRARRTNVRSVSNPRRSERSRQSRDSHTHARVIKNRPVPVLCRLWEAFPSHRTYCRGAGISSFDLCARSQIREAVGGRRLDGPARRGKHRRSPVCGRSLGVKLLPSKQVSRVRFSATAPYIGATPRPPRGFSARLLFLVSKSIQDLPFEKMVDQAATLDRNTFNHFSRKITV